MNYNLSNCNINFNGGNLSSDGGAILLYSFLNKFAHFNFIHQLPFHDLRKNPEFSNTDIFKQLIIRNILGYFNQDHQSLLLQDPLLSRWTSPCSQPTISRFFNRLSDQVNMDFKSHIIKLACDYINQHIDEPILDVDSTKCETGGKQEGAAKIHHYNTTGFHPLIINEFHSKLLVGIKLRTGKAYSSNGFIPEMDELLSYLNTGNKRIRLRGDSAFYNKEYMEYLENKNIIYYFKVKGFSSVKNAIFNDMFDKNIDFQAYTQENPYINEIQYTVGHSTKTRRVVYKIYGSMDKKQLELLPTIYCVITNDNTLSAEEVMKFYEARGNLENFTKELKDDFDGKRVSHSKFLKNEFEFLLSGLCYNIFHLFQMKILENEDRKIRMNTFRNKYQKIAVRVSKHAREITLSFSSAYPYQEKFLYYLNKIMS